MLGAAIELLADSGIRSLTHLRVDERAGLPKGSTSNVFRTRDALLIGVCEHMAASEMSEVRSITDAESVEQLIEGLVQIFEYLIGPSRTMTAARLALFVEAGHNEALRNALAQGRAKFEHRILPVLAALDAPDPPFAMQLIATCFEGLFLQVICGHSEVDPAAVIDANVRLACLERIESAPPPATRGFTGRMA